MQAHGRQRWLALGWIMFSVALIVTNCAAPPTPSAPQAADATADTTATSTTTTTATIPSQATMLQPCEAAAQVRMLQTPEPGTPPPPTATAANPTPAPPTPTLAPAPSTDRVGFPEGYPNRFQLLFVFDRPDNQQVRVICGNDTAASVSPGEPFPYGSILVMETWRTKKDTDGNVVKDADGHYIREALTGIFVMRKEPGFGVDYQQDRSGEWEYVAYRPDQSVLVPPPRTNACASCHLRQAGATQDYTFRMDLFFDPDQAFTPPSIGPNGVNLFLYTFHPATLTVDVGTTVTWINNDEAEHTVTAKDGSFASETLKTKLIKPGDSFSHTFDTAGTFDYFCAIHPAMQGMVEVRNQ
jgi:hypothetical protein